MVKIFHIKGNDDSYSSNSNVSENIDHLNDLISSNMKIYMVVYRPSCPACKNFIPTWKQFENKCEMKKNNIVIARIHSSNLPKIKQKINVEYVPHITKIHNNNSYDYDRDSRTITDLMEWVGDDEDDEISYFGGKKANLENPENPERPKNLKNPKNLKENLRNIVVNKFIVK